MGVEETGAETPEAEVRPLEEWATAKGHVPPPMGGFRVRVRDLRTGAVVASVQTAGGPIVRHTQEGNALRASRPALHRGPHVAVVRAYRDAKFLEAEGRKAPQGLLMTEAQYDELVEAAYSLPVGESRRRS